jgi:glycine betaine/choline ABC-type transport system substrate-binding protein
VVNHSYVDVACIKERVLSDENPKFPEYHQAPVVAEFDLP